MDKRLIAERFARARDTYSQEARVQQQVAEKMMRLLPDVRFRHIVEFGCGTGSYSRILLHQLQPETLLLNDLCPEMKECLTDLLLQDAVQFMPGDAEVLEFPEKTDLITSCSTLQWFNNPKRFFARCHSFLTDNGYLAFSTFGAENMREIRTLTGHGLDYLPVEKLNELLSPYFETVYAEEEIVPLPFATPLQVLQHLKQTGVTGTEKKIWTRGRLQAFCNGYIGQFSQDGNVSLTYHPIYIIARKKNK
ncbi:malonyl-ACP O-methyltransferase BioC [Bacteroides oleiciplenus]|uniref:Malonyl-[acyl-carrier protein] O-methyltransferase n=2 Tax=Bacteroides oleiciplenus TaxID=626931 RepID=K9DSK8_9BACE|nr:malonyl-ACP O-methyltransferase BioC [Bacteroides oleiciplenus]EKU87854.1 biotin biosynthesis protein BioC [Bacteroides oleiciplenus YIT 12058]RGN30995.1 malonyl-[acyl-carrier protein] O-methyltransferase BioC [Bacteroides oleiciplenus]